MGAFRSVVTVLRIVLASVFLLAAGVLALVADGLGKFGWMVAGQDARQAVPAADAERELKLRAHAVSA